MDFQFLEILQSCNKLVHKDKDGIEVLEKLSGYMQGGKCKQRFAMCILNCVLRKCDVEVFEENATSWWRFLLQLINTVPAENLLNLCFASLKEILICASNVDKVHRDIATKGLDPLLALLVGSSLPQSPQKLSMIQCCIRNFPAPCGQYRSAIEKLLICAIECNDELLCSSACQVFTLLAVSGTAGEKNNKFVENWCGQLYKVINTTHFYFSKLSNKLSDGVDDKCFEVEEISNLIPFSEVREKSEMDTLTILQRIERLLLMLQQFISTGISFELSFPLLKVVHLFCEVSNVLHEKRLTTFHLSLLKITKLLLSSITITVKQFKTILLPFCQQLSKILKSTISLSYLTNRTSAYGCAINMVNHWKVFPQSLNFVETFLILIFTDIKIVKCLSSVEDLNNKRDNRTHTLADDITKHIKKEINHFNYVACQNACAALKLLERLLIINGPLLPVDNMNSIITNILDVFVKVYGKEGFLSPYDWGENRLMLFKIAKSLLTLHHGCIPVAILLSYLSIAASESSDKVRCFCHDVLLQYDSIIHPINVSFYDNLPANTPCDLNGNYSEHKGIEIKCEPMSRPNSNEAMLRPNSNEAMSRPNSNEAMSRPNSNEAIVENSVDSAVLHNGTRSCSSEDELTQLPTLLARSFSEPTQLHRQQGNLSPTVVSYNDNSLTNVSETVVTHTDNSSTIMGYNDNLLLIASNEVDSSCANLYVDIKDDDTVVISDSSEEDAPTHKEKYEPAPRNTLLERPTHLDTMYSPSSKKAKLSNGRGNDGYQEDTEYIAILDTFCEIEADG